MEREVVACRLCPRLVAHREGVPARACFAGETYWRKPVPGFGDEKAWLLIVGLAPSPHGGNRTGRIFTGDLSAKFLFQCLFDEGFANQAASESKSDGLKLTGCYLTAAVKCVPPGHRPTGEEIENCRPYLNRELKLLKHLKAVLVLGQIALNSLLLHASEKSIRFVHGAGYDWEGLRLYVSYHPSPQNTNTGKMSAVDFKSLLKKIRQEKL